MGVNPEVGDLPTAPTYLLEFNVDVWNIYRIDDVWERSMWFVGYCRIVIVMFPEPDVRKYMRVGGDDCVSSDLRIRDIHFSVDMGFGQ